MPDLLSGLTKPGASTVAGPAAASAPGPDPTATPATPTDAPDIAAQFPEIAPVLSGAIAGVYTPKGFTSPRADALAKQMSALQAAGLEFYLPKKNKDVSFVTFNPRVVGRVAVSKADAEGKLTEIFPSAATLFDDAPEAPNPEATTPSASPIAINPPSANTQRKLVSPLVNSLKPKLPSERRVPGAGSVLNSLL